MSKSRARNVHLHILGINMIASDVHFLHAEFNVAKFAGIRMKIFVRIILNFLMFTEFFRPSKSK